MLRGPACFRSHSLVFPVKLGACTGYSGRLRAVIELWAPEGCEKACQRGDIQQRMALELARGRL